MKKVFYFLAFFVHKRFDELRSDMNMRFEQLYRFMWILAGLFATITSATIGFAVWDRRTTVRPVETKVRELEELFKPTKENSE